MKAVTEKEMGPRPTHSPFLVSFPPRDKKLEGTSLTQNENEGRTREPVVSEHYTPKK